MHRADVSSTSLPLVPGGLRSYALRNMRWSWNIGQLAGIDIKLHITFLALLAWVGWMRYTPSHSLVSAAEGVAFVLVFFGVVVLHELGHALTARHFGIRTRDITLLPIGGAAALERMPSDPWQELLVSAAGPAVNVVLALVFFGVAEVESIDLIGQGLGQPGASLVSQLFWVNVSLAAFKLLPAFPMDGGRVLRAYLAMRINSIRASQIAATIGQGMAVVFAVVGLWGNHLLLFIALFVWMGASSESRLVQLKVAMHGVPVRYGMVRDVTVLRPSDALYDVARNAVQTRQYDYPVASDGGLVGVLTREALIEGLTSAGPQAQVGIAMSQEFQSAHPDEMLDRAYERLESSACESMPVVDETGTVVGLLSHDGVGKMMAAHATSGGARRAV